MSRHAAAVTLFVPVRSLAARLVEVPGQAAVVAVLIWTVTDHVARGAAKEAGRQLLQTHTSHSFTYLYSSVCIS